MDGQILGQLQRFPGEEEEETWQAVYPDMVEERQRLATYRNWPPYAEVTPDVLARAGFFYTGKCVIWDNLFLEKLGASTRIH